MSVLAEGVNCSLQVGGCRSEFKIRSRKNLKWLKKDLHAFLIPDHPQAPEMRGKTNT